MSFTETVDTEADPIILPCAPQPLVSILITTTSQATLLFRCLKSLALHLEDEIACEVIIVMNAATDEVKTLVRQTRGIVASDSPANLGVSGGYNRARSLAKGKYLILLHDDTEITPRWLGALVEIAEARPEAGAVCSMVFYPDGKLQNAGAILWRTAQTSTPWGPTQEPKPEDYNQVRPVDYSGTSSLLVRSETWDAIHGLNEAIYPAYYVDVDLSMSIRKHGQIFLFTPHSRIYHHRGASSNPSFRHFMMERNRAVFIEKWGKELQAYEDYAPHDSEARERARAHTEQVAHQLTEKWNNTSVAQGQQSPTVLNTAAQELEHFQRERSLHRAYNSMITSRCEELEAQCQQFAADNAKVTSRCEELETQYQQVTAALHDSQAAHELAKQKLLINKQKLLINKQKSATLKSNCSTLKKQIHAIEKTRWWRWRRKLREILGKS